MTKEDILEEIIEIEEELIMHDQEARRLTERMQMLQETIDVMLNEQRRREE